MQHKIQINTKYKTHTQQVKLPWQHRTQNQRYTIPHHIIILLAKTTVSMRIEQSSAAVLPGVFYYHANTVSGSSQNPFFQHLMLNHWGLTVEPTDKASEGACFANTNQKEVFFKNRGPTIKSLHKYVFMVFQRKHLCKLTGLTNHRTAGDQNTKLCCASVQRKRIQATVTYS